MKTETLLAFGIGALVGGLLLSRVMAAPAPPAAVAKAVWRIPSPGAGYAEQHFPNIHKHGGPAEFYTAPTGPSAAYPNGSHIFVD